MHRDTGTPCPPHFARTGSGWGIRQGGRGAGFVRGFFPLGTQRFPRHASGNPCGQRVPRCGVCAGFGLRQQTLLPLRQNQKVRGLRGLVPVVIPPIYTVTFLSDVTLFFWGLRAETNPANPAHWRKALLLWHFRCGVLKCLSHSSLCGNSLDKPL